MMSGAKLATKRKRGRPAKDPRKAKAQVVRIRRDGLVAKAPTSVGRAVVEAWLDRHQASYEHVVGRKRTGLVTLVEACCAALGITKRTYQRHVADIAKRREDEAHRLGREADPILAAIAKAMTKRSQITTTVDSDPSATGKIQGSQHITPHGTKTSPRTDRVRVLPPKIDLSTVQYELARAVAECDNHGLLSDLEKTIRERQKALTLALHGRGLDEIGVDPGAHRAANVEQMGIESLVAAIADYTDVSKDGSETALRVAKNLLQIEAWLRAKLPRR